MQTVLTIDGPSSLDLDDGVWAEPVDEQGDRICLTIAIAGVATALPHLGIEECVALARLQSVYQGTQMVRAMLSPERTEALSLLPGGPRPVVCLQALISRRGEVLFSEFWETEVESVAKLSYEQVNGVLAGKEDHELREVLRWLAIAAGRLDKNRRGLWGRSRQGEFRDDLGSVITGKAEQLIASTAIFYNQMAGEKLKQSGFPALFRVQDPRQDKAIAPLFEEHGGNPTVLAPLISHCLPRAQHRVKAGLHWALQLPAYARSSSPLRRYEDLVNQRQLLAILRESPSFYPPELLLGVCDRLQDKATAEVERQKQKSEEKWLRAASSVKQLETVTEGQFSAVLRQVSVIGSVPPELEQQLRERLEKGSLTPKHAAQILSEGFPADLKQGLIDKLSQGDPLLNGLMVLNTLGQLIGTAPQFDYEPAEGQWCCRLVWQEQQVEAIASSKVRARELAALMVLKGISVAE
ncbi:RNB domain-containing ribonuclease [Synechococcus elongatus]|uniref:RNB domain-containing ribonuclease n=1 Tax=Synechococcus elongatus TaxID=32046 RepID=UPI000F7EC172|nr:RNB domain-containing ribonuclease [Synechococcus elongatus]